MNPRRLFLTLFSFNARLLPANVWFIVAVFIFMAMIPLVVPLLMHEKLHTGTENGFSSGLSNFSLIYGAMVGMLYLSPGAGTPGQPFSLVPTGEFLLSRPVSRRAVYVPRLALFFLLLVSSPLLKICAVLPDPDLRLTLYHSKNSDSEAYDRLDLYRDQFPAGYVTRLPDTYGDTLVIPQGALLIALWQLWLAFAIALALQVATVVPSTPKLQTGLLIAISLSPALLVCLNLNGKHPMFTEYAFFFFAHYSLLVTLLTLAAFLLVQRLALRRIQDLEII